MGTLALNLGKYKILEKLATGGMAEIHLAMPKVFSKTPSSPNQLYVIKRVIDGTGTNPEFVASLKDEAKALSRLKHPNIVAFREFVIEHDQCYLVMEYVQGKSLQQFLQVSKDAQTQLAIEHVLHIACEIATGLEYAHNCFDQYFQKFINLVHRDINPQNIMISNQGEVKIIDFGISKFDSREVHTQTGFIKGKVSYLSPEQLEHRKVDSRTDLYALGVVLWEMLAGRKLFDGKSNYEKVDQIRSGTIPSLCEVNPGISPILNDLVMKAIELNPENRYQSANEFKFEVLSYMAKHYPSYNIKSFKAVVKEFESIKVLTMPKANSDIALTEKIELPSGLYKDLGKNNIVIDLNRARLAKQKKNLTTAAKGKKIKKRKLRKPPRVSTFDVVVNTFILALTITFISYLGLFTYKAGHLKDFVVILKNFLSLV